MINESTAAASAIRKPLTKDEFEQVCFEAASDSTSCEAYLRNVLTKVRLLLGVNLLLLPADVEVDVENVQVIVVALYHLLKEEHQCDFDISEVLNSQAMHLAERVI